MDGFLAENVENDLQRYQSRLFEAEQGFFHRFHTRAKVANLSFALQLAQPLEHVAASQFLYRDAVQLCEVQRGNAQPLE